MIFETYSYRKHLAERNGEPEVYSYDEAPKQLRHQFSMAFREGIGAYSRFDSILLNANVHWEKLDKICRKEIHSYLAFTRKQDLDERFSDFLNNVESIDDFLSAIEIGCCILHHLIGHFPTSRGAESQASDCLKEINRRFEQHAIGYQFEYPHIIRMDSKLTHAELIKPALQLLTAPLFIKGNEDFLNAHRY